MRFEQTKDRQVEIVAIIEEHKVDRAIKARCLCGIARKRDVMVIQIDEPSAHVLTPGMLGERTDQVVSLSATDRYGANRTGRRAIQCGADLCLHDRQPASESRVRVRVVFMPRLPVHDAGRLRHHVTRGTWLDNRRHRAEAASDLSR